FPGHINGGLWVRSMDILHFALVPAGISGHRGDHYRNSPFLQGLINEQAQKFLIAFHIDMPFGLFAPGIVMSELHEYHIARLQGLVHGPPTAFLEEGTGTASPPGPIVHHYGIRGEQGFYGSQTVLYKEILE